MRSRLLLPIALVAVIVVLAAPALLRGQSSPPKGTAAAQTMSPGAMHDDMMKKMAAVRASDAAIESLLKKMEAARGPAREDAMAELVTALAHDHLLMHESMATMCGGNAMPRRP